MEQSIIIFIGLIIIIALIIIGLKDTNTYKTDVENQTESKQNSIEQELHEMNKTLSFFKTIVKTVITFIVIKYIILFYLFGNTGYEIIKAIDKINKSIPY